MSPFIVEPPQRPAAPVRGGNLCPIRRIYCVGQNYADHAREMGSDGRQPPFFFCKPADAVVTAGRDAPYPPRTADLHHEVELVAVIGAGGFEIAASKALDHVIGYAVGLDLTRRDLQAEAKRTARPWDLSKGFDHSAPIGEISLSAEVGHPASGEIVLEVNGQVRQRGDLASMTWSVAEIIAHLSAFVRLEPGDLIFSGTPAGVGPVQSGDLLEGRVAGLETLRTRIGTPAKKVGSLNFRFSRSS